MFPSPTGQAPLSNAAAKPIAERIYAELAAEFHPTAIIKVMSNLNRIHHRELKSGTVRREIERAHWPPDGAQGTAIHAAPLPPLKRQKNEQT